MEYLDTDSLQVFHWAITESINLFHGRSSEGNSSENQIFFDILFQPSISEMMLHNRIHLTISLFITIFLFLHPKPRHHVPPAFPKALHTPLGNTTRSIFFRSDLQFAKIAICFRFLSQFFEAP